MLCESDLTVSVLLDGLDVKPEHMALLKSTVEHIDGFSIFPLITGKMEIMFSINDMFLEV